MLEWTGERYLPSIDPNIIGAEIHYEHLHRYAFAKKFAKRKIVLDLASGEGYGSYILSNEADSVIGIEIDENAVKHACKKYQKDGLKYIKGSILDIPIDGTEIFDVAVCFEAIEHVKDHKKLLSEISRLLKNDGILIISTPNKEIYTNDQKYNNPFHLNELNYDEFEKLLKDYFSHIYILGQRIYTGSNIWPLNSNGSATLDETMVEKIDGVFVIEEGEKRSALYFIAIASKIELQERNIRSYLIDASNTILVQRDTHISEISSQLQEITAQSKKLQQTVFEQKTLIKDLNDQLNNTEEIIKNIVLRTVNKFQNAAVEKICSQNTYRRNFYNRVMIGGRVLADEGWKSLWLKYLEYRTQKKLIFKRGTYVPAPDVQNYRFEDAISCIDQKASIVIPTKNAGRDFKYTMEKIRGQKGLKEIEIVIVDSGSNDDTLNIARKYNANIYEISPDEFNHGKTRNFGASKASGDYIVFMVQDAIPIGDYWLHSLVRNLENNGEIAAAICRQIPKSDADLFACSSIWNHYRYLQFDKDMISYIENGDFIHLNLREKRKIAGLDNVCCCIKKDIFDKFRYKDIDYAEDFELGIRLIENKYKLCSLYSTAVIHSHNREPEYIMRRSYVETKTLIYNFGEIPAINVGDSDVVLGGLLSIYKSLKYTNNLLVNKQIYNASVDFVFSEVRSNLFDEIQRDAFKEEISSSLDNIFFDFEIIIDKNIKNNRILYSEYITAMDSYQAYLTNLNQHYPVSELFKFIYKIFASFCGMCIGRLFYFNSSDKRMEYMNDVFSKGV